MFPFAQRVALEFALAGLLAVAGSAAAAAAERTLDRPTLSQLATLPAGTALVVDTFPVGPTRLEAIRFERVEIYSADARLLTGSAGSTTQVPRSTRVFLRGYSPDGSARVAMSLEADSTFAEGSGLGPEGSFVLHAQAGADGASAITAQKLESQLPAGFQLDFSCGNEKYDLMAHAPASVAQQLQAATSAVSAPAATGTHVLRFATVAVDTDNPFMLKLFNNNTTSATNWIASMFNLMNLMYERDLLVRLYVGTSYYQTAASDPYTTMTASGTTLDAMNDNLNFFSNYWKTHHPANSPTRAFAILLSGLLPSTANSCSSSGIAWIDAYCQTGTLQNDGSTYGSYSVNQVCTSTNAGFGPAFSALLVGHELGHNFGASHTHCTNVSTGAADVGTNTIDTCFNKESGCYSGPASCPAGGAGTIMSYCNMTSVSSCPSGTQNLMQFHPTHISKVLLPTISSETTANPACLNTTDDVFFNGFE